MKYTFVKFKDATYDDKADIWVRRDTVQYVKEHPKYSGSIICLIHDTVIVAESPEEVFRRLNVKAENNI